MYDFTFADGRKFDLIATDGGLLAAPVPSTSIPLSPGERAEIVVTMAPGERVALQSQAPDPALNAGSATFDVMELRAAASPRPVGRGSRDARRPAGAGCRSRRRRRALAS